MPKLNQLPNLIEWLGRHTQWVEDEYDEMTVRLASVGEFKGWDDWKDGERYKKADSDVISAIESLLIFSHQPAYNKKNKESMNCARGFRLFNTGKIGRLLPELSYLYHVYD